ncbi:tyrosine--tRNA ligase [soil metagenome]
MPRHHDLIGELTWRGLLHQHTDRLPAALVAGEIRGYCGFDPTANSLHVGSLVPIMGLVHLQRAGHVPVALIGGGTALIGDPSGKAAERPLIDREEVEANGSAIREQLSRFLDPSGPGATRYVDNSDWLLQLRAVDFMREVGKHFTVNYMLAKDSVRSRFESGISYTEFSYMLLQAYDFLQLYRREGVTLQLGGSDQWGNITAGLELVRRADGGEAHGLTLPLVTTADGTKFGKTEAGTVWLDADRTSPYRFYQFWINVEDRDAGPYLRMFTLLPHSEIEALEAEVASHPEGRAAQQVLAREVTTMVHGSESAGISEAVSGVLFGGRDSTSLDDRELDALADEIPSASVTPDETTTLADLFVAAQLVPSRSRARALVTQGGAYVNGVRVTSETVVADITLLAGRRLLLRKGARDYALVSLGG